MENDHFRENVLFYYENITMQIFLRHFIFFMQNVFSLLTLALTLALENKTFS